MASLSGCFRFLQFFDVAEEIRLDSLAELLKLQKPGQEHRFPHQVAGYVRFETQPIEERTPAVALASGEHFPVRIRYYDYGVIAIELELPFENVDWPDLISLACKYIASEQLEGVAQETLRRQLQRITGTLNKPFTRQLSEDYAVIDLRIAQDVSGRALTAQNLVDQSGQQIAQLVRAESQTLSDAECHEVLAASLSYSSNDLLVVGWTAALVYDTQADGAGITLQLLEYANTQLLEFRHYDEVLTRVLKDVYAMMARRTGFFRRWTVARQALKLNALRLEVTELAERADTAIKFLSDMFYARAYRLSAARIGVPDYRTLVEEKLRTAGELYQFLMDEFHQARAFVLELMVVIILVIELIFLFKGIK